MANKKRGPAVDLDEEPLILGRDAQRVIESLSDDHLLALELIVCHKDGKRILFSAIHNVRLSRASSQEIRDGAMDVLKGSAQVIAKGVSAAKTIFDHFTKDSKF